MKLKGTYKNSFRESFSAKTDCKTLEGIRASFLRILRQMAVTELRPGAFDLACLPINESPRVTKRIFGGALNYFPCLLFLFSVSLTQAQPLPYTFNVVTQGYLSFNDGVSLNGGQVWDDPSWEVPIGFDFEYMNQTFNSLVFGGVDAYGGELLFGTIDGGPVWQQIGPYMQDVIDGGFFLKTPSDSPVQYKLTGNPGSRVFWIQWSNAAFFNEGPPHTMRMNFQMRLYEGTNQIDFHYGPRTLLGVVIQDYNGIVIGMGRNLNFETFVFDPLWAFTGDPQAPEIVAYTDFNLFANAPHLMGTPSDGTVYRFLPPSVNVDEEDELQVKVYPTVLRETLNVVWSGNSLTRMRVFDNAGRVVVDEGIVPGFQQVSVQSLSSGHYLVVVGSGDQMHTTRVVKY